MVLFVAHKQSQMTDWKLIYYKVAGGFSFVFRCFFLPPCFCIYWWNKCKWRSLSDSKRTSFLLLTSLIGVDQKMRFVFVIIHQSSGEDKITVLLNMVASWSVYRRLFRLKKKKKPTMLLMIYVLQMFSVIYRGNHNHESSRAPGCDRWREHCAALPGFTRSDSRSEVHLVLQWAGHPLWKSRGLLWKSRWGESMCASLHSLVWVSSM